MAVVRWTNLICGALLVIAALGFVVFVPSNLADYAREPEDVWLGGIWIGSLGLLAALCFANAWRSNRPPRFGWRIFANLVAVIALAVLLVLGRDDPAVPPLLALCALGPVVALVGAWRHSRVQP
jgi:CHASE2 domain-containing sensor protein